MSFIVINEDGVVNCTPEGLSHKIVKALYDFDKTNDKEFFNKSITYIHHAYSRDGVYKNKRFLELSKSVCENYIPDHCPEDFEGNPYVKAVIDLYIDVTLTESEKLIRNVINEFSSINQHLSNIPWTKKVKIQISEEVPITVEKDGEEYEVMVPVDKKIWVDIDNSAAKIKAFDLIKTALDHYDELKKRIDSEILIKRTRRMFDVK